MLPITVPVLNRGRRISIAHVLYDYLKAENYIPPKSILADDMEKFPK